MAKLYKYMNTEIGDSVLKAMAWNIFPISNNDMNELSRMTNVSAYKVKEAINEIAAARGGIVVYQGSENGYKKTFYRLADAKVTLKYLNELRNDHKGLTLTVKKDGMFVCGREIIQNLILKNPQPASLCLNFNYEIQEILTEMTGREEWQEFYANLPYAYRMENLRRILTSLLENLQVPDEGYIRKTFLENPLLNPVERAFHSSSYALFSHVLSGKTDGLEDVAFNQNDSTSIINCAIAALYKGDPDLSVKLFEKALKMLDAKLFKEPLFSFYYIWALESSSKKTTAHNKMEKLYKASNITRYINYNVPRLLIAAILHKDHVSYIARSIFQYQHQLGKIHMALTMFIIEHFHFETDFTFEEEKLLSFIDKDCFRLLQLEFSSDFDLSRSQEELSFETNLQPLFPPIKKMHKWEELLGKLIETTRDREVAAPGDTKRSNSRIAYYIDYLEEFIPKLQTTKDGKNWSKGRRIAMATFRDGIPEMNETDKAVSKLVTSRWYNNSFELGGNAVFAALAGYPWVFSERNPDVPVLITKENPSITITRNRRGEFVITSNLYTPERRDRIGSGYVRIKDSEYSYRIIATNEEQLDLIYKLCSVKSFPHEAEKMLLELSSNLGKQMDVHSDLIQNQDDMPQVEGDSTIVVLLKPVGDSIQAELVVKPFGEEPPYCTPGKGNMMIVGTHEGVKRQAVRNLEEEKRRYEEVCEWLSPVSSYQDGHVLVFEDSYDCLEMLDILRLHVNDFRIEWPSGAKYKLSRAVDFSNISLSVNSMSQWFELDGEVSIDEKVRISVAEMIARLKESKGRFVRLDENEFIAVSEQLRKQLMTLGTISSAGKDKLKMSPFSIGILDEIENLGASLSKDTACKELCRRIEDADKKEYSVPEGLNAELRPYQTEGYKWMSRLYDWNAGACLADDMGLGKTIQAIALMLDRVQNGPSLVVAPTSVAKNWVREIQRFAPSLHPVLMNEASDRKEVIQKADNGDVVITSYGLLSNEAETLSDRQWNVIVLDEAHNIKNKETKMSKSAMTLKGAFRLMLTGTPLQNHLSEIWTLFQFATPGLLGTYASFTSKFINPIEKHKDSLAQKHLKRLLQPFILRRTKNEVLDELPPKTEITLNVELSQEEMALYEDIRQKAVDSLNSGAGGAIQALAEITRLRQAACNPKLLFSDISLESSKASAFMKLVGELMESRHRVLVFSQFTSHLALIREKLDSAGIKYCYLDGAVNMTERERIVKSFQTGTTPLFLISLKAGGTGLNLTAADYVIHLDPWWNPAIEDQASDRAYRIGQQRPVTVYRLISSSTIEEKIIQLHKTKKSLSDALLDGSNMAFQLTKEEILALMSD